MQTLICWVVASASEWTDHHSLALAATEKSRVQSTLVLATPLRWEISAVFRPEPTVPADSVRRQAEVSGAQRASRLPVFTANLPPSQTHAVALPAEQPSRLSDLEIEGIFYAIIAKIVF